MGTWSERQVSNILKDPLKPSLQEITQNMHVQSW
jgi:hypothetical protein